MTRYLQKPSLAGLFALLLLFPALSRAADEAPAAPPETVCLQCHSGQDERLSAPIGLWRTSIHAANGISCNDCHGGDPADFAMAMTPERGFLGAPEDTAIPAFCGRCHVGVEEDYRASKHGQALGKGGPHCVTCHGNHGVQRASLDLINPNDCSRCHTYERAATIRDALAATDARIAALESDLAGLHRIGITTRELSGKVFAQRNDFHRLFHSVDVDKVREGTAGVLSGIEEVESQVAAIHADLGQRKLWGGIAIALLVGAGILFLLLRRTLPHPE